MKKILMLSVTAGNGHNACARFVKTKIEEMLGENVEIKVVDFLKTYSTKRNFWTADSGYNLAVSKLAPIYNMFFRHYRKIKPHKRWKGMTQGIAISGAGGLLKEVLEFKPDVVFCTHFYGAIAMTDLKLCYNLPCKVVVTSLDYTNSPFWESAIGVDYFNLPGEDFVEENIKEGFKREQLLTLGIPVDEKTLAGISKKQARQELGIDEDVFTCMVMFGGGFWKGGFKIFNNLVNALKGRKAQIIMINGRNEKDFKRIECMTFPEGIKVVNVGFTKQVPLYMSASDVILNKCGGLCSTEMVNVGRPMLITQKIPQQELYNLEYLKSKGLAMSFKNKNELAKGVITYYENPALREEVEEKFQPFKKNAVENLANLLLSFDNADEDMYNKLSFELGFKSNDKSFKDAECKAIRKKVKKATKKQNKICVKEYKNSKK